MKFTIVETFKTKRYRKLIDCRTVSVFGAYWTREAKISSRRDNATRTNTTDF